MASYTFGFNTAASRFNHEAERQIMLMSVYVASGLNNDIKRSAEGLGSPVASGALQANTNMSVGSPDLSVRANSSSYRYPPRRGSQRSRALPPRQFAPPSQRRWASAIASFRLGQTIFIANGTIGRGGHGYAYDIEVNATGDIQTAPSWQAPGGFFERTIRAGVRRANRLFPGLRII